jgi:N-acetylneuraminic acid mutarotase
MNMRRFGVALVLLAFVATACASGDDGPNLSSPSGRGNKPNTWRVIAEGPIKSDYGHKGVWTGKEVIIWGGSRLRGDSLESYFVRTGAAYDPEKDSWRKLPGAPIPGGSGYSAVWTGEEMVLWGDPRRGRRSSGNVGTAYDPTTNTWRRIAPGPLTGRSGHLAVWTGDEMIVWGGYLTAYHRERYDGAGAAYDPDTDSWRRLPRAPLPAGYDAKGAWTGEEVLVMVTPMGNDQEDYPKFDELAAYNPESNSWRSLARPSHVSYVSPPITFVNGKLCVLSLGGTVDGGEVNGYGRDYATGGIYDYSSDLWTPHADPPQRPNQTWEQTAMRDEIVIDALAYRPSTDTWRTLPEFPLREREFPVVVWTGRELIVWGGAKEPTGNVIVDPPPPLHDGAAYTPPK